MDTLSPIPSQQPSTPSKLHWPHARAERGQTYGVEDPIFAGDKLVVMANDTWLDYGTAFEHIRRQCEDLTDAAQKLKVAYDAAIAALASVNEKHQNLRAAEKSRRMAVFTQGRTPKKRRKKQ